MWMLLLLMLPTSLRATSNWKKTCTVNMQYIVIAVLLVEPNQ